MYGINDVFDYESDLRNPRKGGVEGALLDRAGTGATLIASGVLALPFLVYLVAVGRPGELARARDQPVRGGRVLGEGAALQGAPVPRLDHLQHALRLAGRLRAGARRRAPTLPVVALLVAFFLWGAASHAFGAVQDVVADREAGIGSIATVIGARATVRLAIVAVSASPASCCSPAAR